MFSTPIHKSPFTVLVMGTDGLVKTTELQIGQSKEEVLFEKLCLALTTGYRMFDTAENYETLNVLMLALKKCQVLRKEVRIIYKIKPDREPKEIYKALLKAVEIADGYLDVVMLHEANDQKTVKAALVVLQTLVKDGQAGCVGLSNTNHLELPEYSQICPIQYVQNKFTVSNYLEQAETLNYCLSNKIVYMGFGIIRDMPQNELLKSIALKYNCTPAQVLLAWARQLGVIQIVGSSQVQNIKENWCSLQISLDEEAVLALTNLAKQSLISAPIIQSGTPVPEFIPEELRPFYQAVQLLATMEYKLGTEDLLEQKKKIVIESWNTLQLALKQQPNKAIQGLLKWKGGQSTTLLQLIQALIEETGICSAPDQAKAVLERINAFFKQTF